jgi:hypothetical protein
MGIAFIPLGLLGIAGNISLSKEFELWDLFKK